MVRTADRATFTDFLRDPNRVVKSLERGDVRLERRQGDDLLLSYADRAEYLSEALRMYARLLSALLRDQAAATGLTHDPPIPWLRFLPPDARRRFLEELAEVSEAAGELGVSAPIAQLVHEWRETAAIYADPALRRELSRPLPGDGSRVPPPSP